MSEGVRVITVEEVAALEVLPRELQCARTAWCLARANHPGPCIELARTPHVEPDFGPNRSKR